MQCRPNGELVRACPTREGLISVRCVCEATALEHVGRSSQMLAMCGRYASFLPAEALARTFGTVNPLPNFERTWNMAPTRDGPVIRLARDGQRHLDALKWGLVPYFTKDLKNARKPINARSETVSTSGMFREGVRKAALSRPCADLLRMARRSGWEDPVRRGQG